MRKGCELIKLRASGRQYKRTYYLDDQMRCIRWVSSNKRHARAQIHITEIHDVQLGCSSRAAHSLNRRRQSSLTLSAQSSTNSSAPLGATGLGATGSYHGTGTLPRSSILSQTHSSSLYGSSVCLNLTASTFTINHGPEFETLELLANTPEEANIWVTGLKCLMTGAQDPHILEERQKSRDRWLQRVFNEADHGGTGYLSEFDALRLIRTLNPHLSATHLRQQLKESEFRSREHKGRLDRQEFVKYFKKLTTRQEIYYILVRYASGAELLTKDDLRHFFETEQGRCGISAEQCEKLIDAYEPSAENRDLGFMGIDGFTALLLSQECDVFDSTHLQVCQDMSQPITHYYMAASHKTFLLEDQITGPCSVEGYQRALLSGCRYVEIEVHDGHNGHPVVRRTNSRPGIPVQSVLETINDFGFIRSEYPLVVSVECYASPPQQLVLASLVRCCFGSRLLLPTADFLFTLGDAQLEVEERVDRNKFDSGRKNSLTTVDLRNESTMYTTNGLHVRWPSPRDLIGRILLQGKRLPKGTTGSGAVELMNGRSAVGRRFSHFNNPSQSCVITRELSDLYFFDSSNYDVCSTINDSGVTMPTSRLLSAYGSKSSTKSGSVKYGSSLVVVGTHSESRFPVHKSLSTIGGGVLIDPSTSPTPTGVGSSVGCNSTSSATGSVSAARVHPYHFILMSESEASRALGDEAGVLVQFTRKAILKVLPSPSRADSSNLNPLDIWAWGGQCVPLNYQTAGLIMDLATGFFARNGACGYVLKPLLYRQASSFFTPAPNPSLVDLGRPPDTTPQIFRLRILSAQQLPKPRGSVSKGDTIEPYVVIEIHGIPVDCTEQRTSTAAAGSASGYNATFDDTFEFCVQLGSLALVRFVVLDDHAIGDDFIGQNTIPFDCLLQGYRHVRLRSDTGEPIPLATLFIHVTITTKTLEGNESTSTGVLQRWRSRKRQAVQLKKVGTSTFDELFRNAGTTLQQAAELRSSLTAAFDSFRRICGETSVTMSMAQCIRSLTSRLTAACGNPEAWPIRMRIRLEDDLPHLELQASSPVFGSSLSVYPSLSTLGDSGSRGSQSVRFSPTPSGLQRSPSLILSSKMLFSRRIKRESRSTDEETASSLSIDLNPDSGLQREASPLSTSLPRRPSIQSSTSSVSSMSLGGIDKMRRTVNEFETLMEACKMVIKQGPYLRVKLQHMQKAALEAYTLFLEGLKEPGQVSSTKSTEASDNQNDPGATGSMPKSGLLRLSSRRPARFGSVRADERRRGEEEEDKSVSGSGGGTLYWRRMSKVADMVTWNLRILTGQAETLAITLSELNTWLRQARESGAATGLLVTSSHNAEDTTEKLDSSSSISDSVPALGQSTVDLTQPTSSVTTTTINNLDSTTSATNVTPTKLSTKRTTSRLILKTRSKI
ncbi:Phosphoinositide phospholipase C [Fasciola gigantica]|uniref:Phosphoinositide phospholipase C n=1 Tax=Fasciola gigantica TaxID=46835 RepID=A0A504XRW3_FASGI|nr:Phosphoinositide phospholipase C [Fasciola gigantica]